MPTEAAATSASCRPASGSSATNDAKGAHRSGGAFGSKSEAWKHYRDVIEPELHGRPVARRDLTFSELVDVFLDRHAIVAKPRTTRSFTGG